jgi:hypothetical protein
MAINYRLKLKVIRFITLMFIMLLLCFQSAAWATIGIGEWENSTPGGNKIGNNDGLPSKVHTAIYKDYSTIYVKNVQEYGFYTGAIIGKADQGFFLFNERTKEVNYFPNQEQLCSKVKEKNLLLASIYSFYQLIYYFIRYSLYFLIPFIILFLIHYQRQQNSSLHTRVDTLLKNKMFGLQLYATSVGSNFVALLAITLINPDADFLGFIIFAPLGLIVLNFILLVLWSITQVALKLIGVFYNAIQNINILNIIFINLLTTLLKLILFVGIFVTGLSLTFSTWEAPLVSVKYFSCHFS